MARMLLIGGGCRGLELARRFGETGQAVRVTTRTEAGRAAIEASGAECWIGTPDRIGTLREAMAGVTVLCWLLGTASGEAAQVAALHGPRLQMMLSQAIDTTVRGVVYEAAGSVEPGLLGHGAELVREAARRSSIPFAILTADPSLPDAWTREAQAAIEDLLGAALRDQAVQA